MRFVSICSGLEAATVALGPIGWQCVAVAEIDPFCCHLLHKRYGVSRPRFMPRVADAQNDEDAAERRQNIKLVAALPENAALPNLGDITQADPSEFAGKVDVLVGGPPCQAFSVAGLRKGLADARGNLTLRFVQYADAIEARYTVFENVPGILSDAGNAFGCFLGGIAGADSPLVPARGQRWTDCGVVNGPKRRIAWRTLDAQWYGLAQRRARVFVVASAGDGAHPIQILLNEKGMWGNTAPRREEREATAGTLEARTRGGGGLGTDFECAGGGLQVMMSSPHLRQAGEEWSDAAKAEDRTR